MADAQDDGEDLSKVRTHARGMDRRRRDGYSRERSGLCEMATFRIKARAMENFFGYWMLVVAIASIIYAMGR